MDQNKALRHIIPDSLTGSIVAFEGINSAATILNSPTGCKFGPSFLIYKQRVASHYEDPFDYQEEFFFGQPRIPTTYLDELDFVNGSEEKLIRLLKRIESKEVQLIGIVNGPPASLIGDDLKKIAEKSGVKVPVVDVDITSMNGPASLGFTEAMLKIVDKIQDNSIKPHDSLVLCGTNLLMHRWNDNLIQLKKELGLLGLTNIVSLGAGSTIEELSGVYQSAFSAHIDESYGYRLSERLAKKETSKNISKNILSPIGIIASERWLLAIADMVGADKAAIINKSKEVRRLLFNAIAPFNSKTGLPTGLRYVIAADASIAAPLLLFLTDYLGMYPAGIILREPAEASEEFIRLFINDRNIDCSVFYDQTSIQLEQFFVTENPDIIFGSGYDKAVVVESLGSEKPFVHIAYPELGKVSITYRPFMGLEGSIYLVEDILNAIILLADNILA